MADGGERFERSDMHAERAILGAVLLNPDRVPTVAALVKPSDMANPAHAVILDSVVRLFMDSKPIDTITVAHALRQVGRLETVGGPQYLGELSDCHVTLAHLAEHCRLVARHAAARRVIAACAAGQAAGADASLDADGLIDEALRMVTRAAESRPVHSEPQMLDVAVQELFAELEKAGETGEILTGLKTGFRDLDALTAGMHEGEQTILAARPSIGKTAFALAVALHAAHTKPVLFYSYEMTRKALTRRLAAMASSVPHEAIRTAQLSQENLTKLAAGAQRIYNLPLALEYNMSASVLDIAAHARNMKSSKRGLGLIVIDYLQLVAPVKPRDNREREVAEISRALKKFAGELEVPILALSQLNRLVETRGGKKGPAKPQLADLRESGAIEQDADVVVFLHRETKQSRECEVIVAKQRNGPCESVMVNYVAEFTRFENIKADPPANNWQDVDDRDA